MELVAAPGRVPKTFTFWINITIVIIGGIQAGSSAFSPFFDPKLFAAITTALGGLSVALSYIKQNIPVTPEQKVAMVDSAASAPMKAGQADPGVTVTVANPPEPKGE